MIYLTTFALDHCEEYRHVYPYGVFSWKYYEPFVFEPITVLYGDNGSGKSTILNLIAQKLHIDGVSDSVTKQFDYMDYFSQFVSGCSYEMGKDIYRRTLKVPKDSKYMKSQDLLYEVKKVEQKEILKEDYLVQQIKKGMTQEEAIKQYQEKLGFNTREQIISFAQQKYSNGETAMQYMEGLFTVGNLYLLDEPEVSLSPQNQVRLAKEINELARYCDCQFIIATHSPFLLGQLDARVYAIEEKEIVVRKWSELENMQYFYHFFKAHEREFE